MSRAAIQQKSQGMKTLTIYAVEDDCGAVVSYHATKSERDAEIRWWAERENECVGVEVQYQPTKRGVVALLNSIKQSA